MSHRNCPGSKCPAFSSITALVSKCLETGAEVSQSVLMPKCLVAEVSGPVTVRSPSPPCTSALRRQSSWLHLFYSLKAYYLLSIHTGSLTSH